jgi:hypothetical protein
MGYDEAGGSVGFLHCLTGMGEGWLFDGFLSAVAKGLEAELDDRLPDQRVVVTATMNT